MNTINLLHWMLYPILAGTAALLLFCLSLWEFRKPSAVAKLTGFTWSAFGVGFGSLALMLFIMTGVAWPLRGNATLMATDSLLLGLTALAMIAGISLLLAVVAKTRRAQEARTSHPDQPQEGVWPPPPKIP